MKLLSTNDKTRYSLNLPRTTCDTTCPFYAKTCYARKGRFVFSNVTEANNNRLSFYKENPDGFFSMLELELSALIKKNVFHVRIFGIGDFPDIQFAERLAELTKKLPKMNFWIASYKGQFMQLPTFPQNVTIRFSIQNDKKRNEAIKNNICVSNVIENTSSISNGSVICKVGAKQAENCQECGYICWKKDIAHISYIKH